MSSTRESIERARRLKELCEEPGSVMDILQELKAATLQAAVNANDKDEQVEHLRMVRCMDKLAVKIASIIQSGAHDAAELASLAEEEAKRNRAVI